MKKVTDYLSSLLTVLRAFVGSDKGDMDEDWNKIQHFIMFDAKSTELTQEHREVLKDLSEWTKKYNCYLNVYSEFASDENVSIANQRALNAIRYIQMIGGKVIVSCTSAHGPRVVKFSHL